MIWISSLSLATRDQKGQLLVCMWQGLISCSNYTLLFLAKSVQDIPPTSLGTACSPTQTVSATDQISRYPESNRVEQVALPRNTVYWNSLWVVPAVKLDSLMCVFDSWLSNPIVCHIFLPWCSSVHFIVIQFLGSAPRKHNFSDVAACAADHTPSGKLEKLGLLKCASWKRPKALLQKTVCDSVCCVSRPALEWTKPVFEMAATYL